MDFVAIDFETANADCSSVCQVGAVTFQNGDAVGTFASLAERKQQRQQQLQEWQRLHDERVRLCELRRARNNGPRCGAKTRTGAACERKPELGKRRCRCHGGCSTGPRTVQGRARALAALQRAREHRRCAR